MLKPRLKKCRGVLSSLFHPPGEFIKSVGDKYNVVKRGGLRECHGHCKEYSIGKRERGSIIFSIISRLSGRISSGERGGNGNIG